jgi:hypothetical protein
MLANESQQTPSAGEPDGQGTSQPRRKKASKRVTEARAVAQRAKLAAQAEAREQGAVQGTAKQRGGKPTKPRLQASRRANTTIARY